MNKLNLQGKLKMQQSNYKVLITLRRELVTKGGVRAYWNALLPEMHQYNNLRCSVFEMGGHGKNVFGPLIDQWKFRKQLVDQPSLVFLNPSLGSRSFFRDGFFAKQLVKKGTPFIVFFHGWNLDFEKKVDDKYVTFFLNSFGKARKIFVLSQDFKNKISEWGYKGEIIIETTNIDASLLKDFLIDDKISQIKSSTNIKILFLARLLRGKGVFETVAAFRHLSKKHDSLELTFAGDGKDLDELKDMVKNDVNIIVAGHVEGQRKIDLFRENHIYCLPSYSEGLPTSVLEAMAFGMPIVTSPVGGLKKFFKDEQMGYFVAPKNVVELEKKLELLLLDRHKMIKIGKFNYTYAKKKLLNTVVAERMYSYMISILNDK